MTNLDDKFRPLAASLIAKFGKSITLTGAASDPVYDPSTGGVTAGTPSTQIVKALIEDYSLHSVGAAFSSGLILTGDKKISIAARGLIVSPTPGFMVTLNGVVWNVVNVQETWSGEQVAMYALQVRK